LEKLVQETVTSRDTDPESPKLTFLLLSGLADIATLAKREPEKLALATENVVLQGDYSIEQGPISYHAVLKPNLKAANNGFDKQATTEFHNYIDSHHIPSIVFTRAPAMAARQDAQLFQDLKETKHVLGQHLENASKLQDTSFYERACSDKPFMPALDQQWFLNGKTKWYQDNPRREGVTPIKPPVGAAIIPYVQLVFYDVLAAVGAAGDDVLQEL